MAANRSNTRSMDNPMVYSTGLPIFYTIIPASIRKRIPRFYSLHKRWSSSTSHHDTRRLPNDHHRALTISSESDVAFYQAAASEGASSARGDVELRRPATAQVEMREASSISASGSASPSASHSVSSAPEREAATTPAATNYESESGLRWNRVVPAFNLLRNAGYEAQQPQADGRLVRSLYVNALVYLLDALPDDLTHEETRSLQQKFPERAPSNVSSCPSCASCLHHHHHDHPLLEPAFTGSKPASSNERSYLHRLLASSIVQFFLLIQFLMPHVKVLIREMYRYERAHRITERVVASALDVADALGKGGVNLGSTILTMQEGKVGAIVSSLAGWWVESVAGGIYEGVGEGMTILGVIRPNSMELEKVTFQMNGR